MNLVFIHQNMPGQYRGLMPFLAKKAGYKVVAIGDAQNIRNNFRSIPAGVRLLGYQMPRIPPVRGHAYLQPIEHYVFRGERLARTLLGLKNEGFYPDVICSHAGWGESLYIKDVFPDAKLINYCEFFYRTKNSDFGFDPEYPEEPLAEWTLRTRNAVQLISLNAMDIGLSPTDWQAGTYPKEYRPLIKVVHEGVDTQRITPDPQAYIRLQRAGITLTEKDEIITFISRNLEPYRGFHIFMRALPRLMKERPNAHFIIVGGEGNSYSRTPVNGTYKQKALAEVGHLLDSDRVHFLGKIPYNDFLALIKVSTVHVYLTYPFVLSWSMLESMAVGGIIVGSRTAPVQEVIEDGKNGFLFDFFSVEQIVEKVSYACENRESLQDIRAAARQTIVDRYDFESVCLPKHIKLIEETSNG